MRKNSELLCWARAWHWPQLVLDTETGSIIRAGEASWKAFAFTPDRKAKLQAWQRIHQWNDLVAIADEAEMKTA